MRAHSTPFARLIILLIAALMATSNSMAENTIDFSKSTNLKAVYSAGLRPWRVRSDEISTLLITDQQVRVIVPSGGVFSMPVQIGNFGVIEGNQLAKADFVSEPMLLSQAVAKAREICNALGIDLGRGAGMVGFEEKASQLLTMKDQTPTPQYWNGRNDKNGVSYSVTLSPLFGLNETRAKVDVTLGFSDPGKPMKFLSEPIEPPAGYEDVSMEPPPRDPNQKPFPNPEYSFENMVKRVEAAKAAEGRASAPTMTSSASAPTTTPKPSPVVQAEPSKSSPWQWLIGAILLLAVVGGILFKVRRK